MPRGIPKSTPTTPPQKADQPAIPPLILLQPSADGTRIDAYGVEPAECIYELRRALIHFDEPIGSDAHQAQHYLGYARSVRQRVACHQRGYGHGRLVQVFIERGITWAVAREWPLGDRSLEKRLKRRHLRLLCPICSGEAARRRGNYE